MPQEHNTRHPMEAEASWGRNQDVAVVTTDSSTSQHRVLRHHHHHHHHSKMISVAEVEEDKEDQFWANYRKDHENDEKLRHKQRKKHRKRIEKLLAHPGIHVKTVHGLMIDAGSTGSRLHIYEWEPRVLRDEKDIEAAVSGEKLSFPGTESRWTDRLRPGLSSFGSIADDDELLQAIADYLQPLMDFAKSVLHSKANRFGEFPIFLRGTAGLRILDTANRARVMSAVRTLFHNATYSPFAFTDEQARILSGEEESVYDWVGVNFLLGDMLQQSQGAGDVSNPRLTHGALDMGGASTQISFYEPNEDIMSNLFKLQIGQAKHWNIYAHSFLQYGMNSAIDRFQARLITNKTREERLIQGIYNPCLPGGSKQDLRTNIHIAPSGVETWDYEKGLYPSGDGFFQAVLVNENERGDVDLCFELTKGLLHLEKNEWCEFAHKGDCSLAGIYQPVLPSQTENFGEFVAFSNYFHIWNFLKLPERATIAELEVATRHACSMTHGELVAFNDGVIEEAELDSYCFRSAYALQLLRNGYGFRMNDTIRVTQVIEGQKVGWALGAMIYEINSMPWHYEKNQLDEVFDVDLDHLKHIPVSWETVFLLTTIFGMLATLLLVFVRRERRRTSEYEMIKDVHITV
jgi:Golgi nucleoside diphosphatase